MTNSQKPGGGGALAGLCVGAAVVLGAPLLGWYVVLGYTWGDLGVMMVAVVGALLLAAGWAGAFAVLRRRGAPRPQLVAWLCLAATVLVSAVSSLVIGVVAGVIGVLTVAFLWTGDYVGPLATISAIAVAVLTLPVAISSGIIFTAAFADRPRRSSPTAPTAPEIRV